MVDEMVTMAKFMLDNKLSLDKLDSSVLNKERQATSEREFLELSIRFEKLSNREIEALSTMTLENQRLLCFISCLRTYDFIKEFMEEVVLINIQLLKYTLDDLDYTVFFNRKALEYNQIESLSDSTKYKVKQVTFKMLEQAGLIDSVYSRKIIIPYLSPQLDDLLSTEDKKYLLQ